MNTAPQFPGANAELPHRESWSNDANGIVGGPRDLREFVTATDKWGGKFQIQIRRFYKICEYVGPTPFLDTFPTPFPY